MRPDNTADTNRPNDWWILGLAADPTPRYGGGVRILAGNFHEFGDAAALSRASVQGLLSDPAVVSWVGDSAIAFEKACEPLPRHLALADQSYHQAGDALESYAPLLESAQASADGALAHARAAIAAVGLTGDALRGLGSADGDSDFRNRLGKLLIAHQPAPPPPPGAGKLPTDLPGPDPDYVIPGAPSMLSSASLDVLNQVVGHRRTAEQAGSDARSAAHKAAAAVGAAAVKAAQVQAWTHDAAGHVVVGSKDGGSFKDRFTQFGGNLGALGALATASYDDQALASRELADLNAALADPTAPWALTLMGAVSSDMAENADAAQLQAFFAGGGADTLAKISLALAPPSDREPYGTGPEPSAAAQAILAGLGSVAASGSMFYQNGTIKLGPNAFDALTEAPVGQVYPGTALLKYGPDGSMWGKAVLGAIGLKMLATNYGSPEENSDKDALLTVMQRISQNPDLCRLMVGSDGVGEDNANYLLHSWYGTSDNPISQAAGQILTNATNDLSGNPDLSTKAAANLFHVLDGSSLPSPLAQAVANTGAVQLESLRATEDWWSE